MRNLISNGLRRLVRSESRYPHGDRHASILSIATVKGGVGKTTTAVNLASALARFEGLRVLLVDLDAQGHCTTSLAAQLPNDPIVEAPTSEVLLAEQHAQLLDALVASGVDGLDVTPADPGLAEAEGRISQKIGKEMLLRDALSITRSHYDVIVIDCPPNKGNLTLNALVASDHVLIPLDLTPLALQGADELLGTILTVQERLGHDVDVLGVLLTRVDRRNASMNQSIRDQIEQAWDDLVLQTEIGVNIQLSQAQQAGQPIFEHAPDSRGAYPLPRSGRRGRRPCSLHASSDPARASGPPATARASLTAPWPSFEPPLHPRGASVTLQPWC